MSLFSEQTLTDRAECGVSTLPVVEELEVLEDRVGY